MPRMLAILFNVLTLALAKYVEIAKPIALRLVQDRVRASITQRIELGDSKPSTPAIIM